MKERVESRNELEGYAYSLKNQVADKEKLGAKLSDEDKDAINKAVDETISWLESNQEAEKEDYEKQKKELESVVHPIINAKVYPDGAPPPGGEGGEEKDEL